MIKVYNNGDDFIKDNDLFLSENKYMSVFFYLDAKLLTEVSNINYAIKCEDNGKKLLALKVEPYNLLLYGNKECLMVLLEFLNKNHYEVKGVLCPMEIGDVLLDISPRVINKEYIQEIGMDFIEATSITEASSEDVEIATINDLDVIYDYTINFFNDCGLSDEPNKEKLRQNISNFHFLRVDGKIVSMASYSYNTFDSCRITHVYTKPEYRSKGYARKVVNTIKNEIINSGKIATLNVDIKNPISNHLYKSLGFKKVFSQGVYKVK